VEAKAIYQQLEQRFGAALREFQGEVAQPFAVVEPARIAEVAQSLRDQPELAFDGLMCLSGVDTTQELVVVYHLFSYRHGHKFTLKALLPRAAPELPTVSGVWSTADWHERECYDLFGVVFSGHPDLRRILLPEDWEGYPLRKDYVVQEYYHGIRVPK
jgi:NADH-quinone oxidoreductase subunit C